MWFVLLHVVSLWEMDWETGEEMEWRQSGKKHILFFSSKAARIWDFSFTIKL